MPVTSMRLLIALGLAALSILPAAAQNDAGKTLRLVPHADLTVVDPQFIGVYITRNFAYLVYDTLFGMDREFRPQPEMVDTWQVSDDKLTYTFRLRDGLKFHDGQPVRAADAVASLKRWGQRNDSYGQRLLAAASAIEAVDDNQFRIVLKNRFPVLEALGTQRHDLAEKIQRRAFEIGLYLPIGQFIARRAFRNSLGGIPDSPIPVLWNIEKH
jgi:peptide/nickel transport system substrate-binding protein